MPRDEMVKVFDIDRIGKAAAVFDKKKLLWMNGQYIRKLPLDTLVQLVEPYVPDLLRRRYDEGTRREIVSILQDSIDTLADFAPRAAIFEPDVAYEEEAKALLQTASARRVVAGMVERLRAHGGVLTPDAFKQMILATGQETGLKGKDLYFPIRGAMTGSVHGPDLTRVAAVKGKDNVLALLEGAIR
jgi:nondiscriminating glutamyl-tRNA synthetase